MTFSNIIALVYKIVNLVNPSYQAVPHWGFSVTPFPKSFLRFGRQSWKEPLGMAFTALRCQATLANRRTPSPSARARVTHKATPEATNLSR